jgi:hypothetical protein
MADRHAVTALDARMLVYLEHSLAEAFPSLRSEYLTAESALRWLLELAWSDLEIARGQAGNGCWSIGCDNQLARIVGLTRLAGPLPWQFVPLTLILDGIYERVHAALGHPTPLSNAEREQCARLLAQR